MPVAKAAAAPAEEPKAITLAAVMAKVSDKPLPPKAEPAAAAAERPRAAAASDVAASPSVVAARPSDEAAPASEMASTALSFANLRRTHRGWQGEQLSVASLPPFLYPSIRSLLAQLSVPGARINTAPHVWACCSAFLSSSGIGNTWPVLECQAAGRDGGLRAVPHRGTDSLRRLHGPPERGWSPHYLYCSGHVLGPGGPMGTNPGVHVR